MPSYSPFSALAQSGVVQAPTVYPDNMGGFDSNNSFQTPMKDYRNPLAPDMSIAEQLRMELLHPTADGKWLANQKEAAAEPKPNEYSSDWRDIGMDIPLPSPTPPAPPVDYASMGQSMAVGPNPQPDALAMNAENLTTSMLPDAMSMGTASSGKQLPVPPAFKAQEGPVNDYAKHMNDIKTPNYAGNIAAIGQGLQSANKAGGTGAKIGGVIGTGVGAAFGGPAGAAIGSAVGQLGGSVVDWYADQADANAREQAKKLAQQKADKYEAMQMAEHNKALEEASQNREFALGDRQHALDLQRKREMAIAAEATFKMQQAKQTQRGLVGFGQNELSLMGPNPLANQRNYQ